MVLLRMATLTQCRAGSIESIGHPLPIKRTDAGALRPLMKKFLFGLALLAPLAMQAVEQNSLPIRSSDAPELCWDVDASLANGYRNFRTTNDPLASKPGEPAPNAAGLASLRASGSSEFTVAGLKAMLRKTTGPVTIFDLRQEDHGFVNGEPISWYASNNWANVGKSQPEVISEEAGLIGGFRVGSVIRVSSDKAKKGDGPAASRQESVSDAETEQQVVSSLGIGYVRIAVSDHCRPTDEEVDRFIAEVRKLPAGAWAHFHCRAGKGRTTTFMALYDMLRNARTVSLLDIDRRQSDLVGDYDLLGKEGETGARQGVAAARAAFVRMFYDYAKANPDGRPLLWSEWLKRQP